MLQGVKYKLMLTLLDIYDPSMFYDSKTQFIQFTD